MKKPPRGRLGERTVKKFALFYDFETTGLPDFSAPSQAQHQPHIVQACAVLVDIDTRRRISGIDLIAKPDGWMIPNDVSEIHGITLEHATGVGVPEKLIVETVFSLWRLADVRIGHNESFDARIMRIALKRLMDDAAADEWKAGESECTMRLSHQLCALPGNKFPKLSEAHKILVGTPLENAHNAVADVDGCMAVYWAIRDSAA